MAEFEDCVRMDLSEFSKLPYFSEIQIKNSSFGSNFPYLHPIEGWENHIVWAYLSPDPPYPELGDRFEAGVEALFRQYPGQVIITGNPKNADYTWICPKLDLWAAHSLMMRQGFSPRIIALHTARRLVFMQDTDLGYCLLCRDPALYSDPLPNVTDEALRREFWEQELGTLENDDVDARHINLEILPYTVERTRAGPVKGTAT